MGENGIIQAADRHACDECTQPFKNSVDTFPNVDPAGVVGVDQNGTISEPIGAVNEPVAQGSNQAEDTDMDIDHAPVKMVVLDGIVMGPQHCAYGDCTSDLANAHGGSFCAFHENQWGARCCVHNCNNQKFQEHKHVIVMQESGISMLRIILIIATMKLEDIFRDLERIYLGSQLLMSICNHMMKLLLKHTEEIILLHPVSTVWKQYVLHVA